MKKQKLKTSKNMKISIALVLMLSIAFSVLTCLPATATVIPRPGIQCTAYLGLRHNPIGINQEVLVNAWTTPAPPRWMDLNMTPPTDPNDPLYFVGQSGNSGIPRLGYLYTITKPDGSISKVGPRTSDGVGTDWFIFKPDQTGTWTVEFSWPGVEFKDNSGNVIASYSSCTTGKQQLIVQADPISYPAPAELPTDQWSYPINSENREWYTISGPYLQPTGMNGLGYDSTGSRFNPYCRAPNSAHVLWMEPPASGMAGIIGGQWNQLPQYGATTGTNTVVMAGRAYYMADNYIYCLDVRSGEHLWTKQGAYSFGTIENSSATAAEGGAGLYNGVPTLVFWGSNSFVKYNGLTGAVTCNITVADKNVRGYVANDYTYAYIYERTPAADTVKGPFRLIKLNMLGTGSDITQRIVYNVSFPIPPTGGVCLYNDVLASIGLSTSYGKSGAVNTTNGQVLWNKFIDGIEQKPESVTSNNGIMYYATIDRHFQALDMKTGNIVWTSPDQADYPWGDFWAYGQSNAYGYTYALSYAGVYAFDNANGKIKWHYSAGDSGMETPYSTIPFGSNDPMVADGKVFAPTSEHSPTLYYRGQRLHVLDAWTGKLVWSIMGYYTLGAVAEDNLFATNAYDGYTYAFAKGKTTTTISTSQEVISKGSSLLIKGSVTDQSPAQPGTPAVSDDSMSAWMEYLHMQQPKPTNTTGVPVTLTAVDQSGKSIAIGTVWSDANGYFKKLWTPTVEGEYSIVATFGGSLSYYGSSAETVVGVAAAAASPSASASSSPPPSASPSTSSSSPVTSPPSLTATPSASSSASESPTQAPPPTQSPSMDTYIIAAAVAIIFVVVVAALILRRRK